jgi:hypothetical protein
VSDLRAREKEQRNSKTTSRLAESKRKMRGEVQREREDKYGSRRGERERERERTFI